MKNIKSDISLLKDELDSLALKIKNFNFNNAENKEVALEEIESAVIALDGLEDVLDWDSELPPMRAALPFK